MAAGEQGQPGGGDAGGTGLADGTEAARRIERAMARIAAAANRRREVQREAELNARAAEHENRVLREAGAAAAAFPGPEPAVDAGLDAGPDPRDEAMRVLAGRLDSLIGAVEAVLEELDGGTGDADGDPGADEDGEGAR